MNPLTPPQTCFVPIVLIPDERRGLLISGRVRYLLKNDVPGVNAHEEVRQEITRYEQLRVETKKSFCRSRNAEAEVLALALRENRMRVLGWRVVIRWVVSGCWLSVVPLIGRSAHRCADNRLIWARITRRIQKTHRRDSARRNENRPSAEEEVVAEDCVRNVCCAAIAEVQLVTVDARPRQLAVLRHWIAGSKRIVQNPRLDFLADLLRNGHPIEGVGTPLFPRK